MDRIKTIFVILILGLTLYGCSKDDSPAASPSEQENTIGGHLTSNLTLDKSPYRVTSTIVIDSSVNISIEAGVKIYFDDTTKLQVKGKISCIGSSFQQILFTSKNASWKGIQIFSSANQSIFQFVIIEKVDVTAPTDIGRNGAVDITGANVTLTNSIFRNNRSNNGGGLFIDQSESVISNNIFHNNYSVVFGGALLSSSSSNKIVNNTFYKNESNNYAGGLLLLSPVLDSVENNIFYSNTNASGDPRIAISQTDSTHFVSVFNFLQELNDPNFVSATDYHLTSNSPCINVGNPASQYNDVDGTRNDQGAYGGPLGSW